MTWPLSDDAQTRIDNVLERGAWWTEEFGVWCDNPVWAHLHSTHRSYDAAVKAIPATCHYGSPAEFVVLARDVRMSSWRQPAQPDRIAQIRAAAGYPRSNT